jgi:hypothetical protein
MEERSMNEATYDKLEIVDMDTHRNGVGGMPFTVALVDDPEQADTKLVIMFQAEGHTAVLSLNKLMEEDISFGTNSWRGDQYESTLRPEMWPDEEDVTDE